MPSELRTLRADADPAFIRRETELTPVPFVPEIRLHMAQDAIALWETTER